jgi:uncharacterized protein (UPF0333 family)
MPGQQIKDKGGEKMKISKKGQSVLEYVIVLTAIIAIIVAAAATIIQPSVNQTLNKAASSISNALNRLP